MKRIRFKRLKIPVADPEEGRIGRIDTVFQINQELVPALIEQLMKDFWIRYDINDVTAMVSALKLAGLIPPVRKPIWDALGNALKNERRLGKILKQHAIAARHFAIASKIKI